MDTEVDERLPGAGQRVGNGELVLNGYRDSVWDEKVQETVVMYPKLFAWDKFLQVELMCQKVFVITTILSLTLMYIFRLLIKLNIFPLNDELYVISFNHMSSQI